MDVLLRRSCVPFSLQAVGAIRSVYIPPKLYGGTFDCTAVVLIALLLLLLFTSTLLCRGYELLEAAAQDGNNRALETLAYGYIVRVDSLYHSHLVPSLLVTPPPP